MGKGILIQVLPVETRSMGMRMRQFGDIDWMKTIHILFRRNTVEDSCFIQSLWKRQLYKNAMNFGIMIELLNFGK